MVDRFSGISIFVQAAEAGSFTRAAERLGLSRSAVGKAIARLEDRLGARLFHRTTRAQSLTDQGQAFYERCLQIIADIEAAEVVLDRGEIAPSGRLRVTAPVLLGRQCVAPILVEFARRHPKVELDLRFTDQVVDLVEERIDLAVRIGPLPDRAGLVARTLGGFDQVLCAAPAYLEARGAPRSLEDLAGHDCLPYARHGGRIEPWRFATDDEGATELTVTGRIRLDDLDAIARAAVQGVGITVLPTWLVSDLVADGRLVVVLSERRVLGNAVYAIRPQTPHVSSKVRAAVDDLARHMPAHLDCARP